MKYDKINRCLSKNGKPVKKTDLKTWGEYALDIVTQGGSLADLPEESEHIPMLASIIVYIDESMAEQKSVAEDLRLKILKEKVYKATEDYRANPSEINKQLVIQLNNSYEKCLAHANADATIVCKYYKKFKDDFFDKIEPEHALTPAEFAKYDKFGEGEV